jgi:Zn-dependent protease with chaperone function
MTSAFSIAELKAGLRQATHHLNLRHARPAQPFTSRLIRDRSRRARGRRVSFQPRHAKTDKAALSDSDVSSIVRMKRVSRAMLAVGLLLGIYLLALGIVGAIVWAAVFASRHQLPGAVVGVLGGLAAVTAAALLVGALQRSRTGEDPGIVLTPQAQPRLWSEVRALAETVGTRAPDEIRLLAEVNASVSERSRFLGLASGKRVLHLGAPLLIGLSSQHLRAVLAHELGHYSGRHTLLGGVTYRGREAITGILQRFGTQSLIGRIFGAYARLYFALTQAMSRRQELEADDFMVEAVGREAAVSSLSELPLLDAAWGHFVQEFVGPVHASGKRPTDFFDGLAQILEAPKLQQALASFRTDFEEPPKGRYDSHPPLGFRIQRLRSHPDDHVSADPAPAIALLNDSSSTLLELQEWMYRKARLDAEPWKELLVGHEPADVRARAEQLYRAATQAESRPDLTLGSMIGSVRGRQLSHWVRRVITDPTREQINEASRELVASAIEEALMTACGARFTLAWDEAPRLVDVSGRTIETRPLVEQAMESGDPALLGRWLEDLGLSLNYAPDFPEVDPRTEAMAGPPRVLDALAPVAGERMLFVVVLTHGVLLRRAGNGDYLAWWTGGRNPGPQLLRRVLNRSGEELLAEEGNIWMPWERIVSVSVGRGRTRRPTLTFNCLDGAALAVKYRMHTRDTGQTIQALQFFLADRLEMRH